jgi:Ketopantoate reductase
MFGATYLELGKVIHNFDKSWILGKPFGPNDEAVHKVRDILSKSFTIVESEDILGMKYLKIFLNANNCIPAILGVSVQDAFRDAEISRLAVSIWKEGLSLVNKSGIKLVSLPDFPSERLNKLVAMPVGEAVKIFSQMMVNLSAEPLYGSILQSIQRGRASEIDFINGEFVSIARENNLNSPLNEKLVEMVHEVEKNAVFSVKRI